MDHQSELEKSKYRNWVRGGLAYKYLKDGLVGFADDVVLREHKRILQAINHTPGLTCNQCNLRNLKPLHKSVKDPTGKSRCPWRQNNCNCMHSKKQACPNKVCDAILEEILKSQCSTLPVPFWKNTDTLNWCSNPWDIAKRFIFAPGYSDKSSAADIDAPGLLHLFINNTSLHAYISCAITGTDIFSKAVKSRNDIFHSPKMELEKTELNECIDNNVQVLEDDKELKEKPEAKQAVAKLKQLKQDNFIITTYNEAEVCRAAMISVSNRTEELKQVIQDAKSDIKLKEEDISKGINENTQKALDASLEKLEKHSESMLETMKQTVTLLKERVRQLELDNTDIKQRLTEIENDRENLKAARDTYNKHLEYIEQKRVLQRKLVERYQKYNVKTWISPLKCQEDEISIEQVYVTPDMVVKERSVPQTESKTSGCKTQTHTKYAKHANSDLKPINQYRDIFQTNGLRYKKIYIIGDMGTGKSSFSKMMIHNWCKSVKGDNCGTRAQIPTVDGHNSQNESNGEYSTIDSKDNAEDEGDIKEMEMFDFLFFVPLQKISGFSSDLFEMIQEIYKDIVSDELIKRIFVEESDHCCIIADGLDEWTIPKQLPQPRLISYGIPNGDKTQNATIVTLSRPSAKGILNLKSSECERKIELRGVSMESLDIFTRKYMAIQTHSETRLGSCLFTEEEGTSTSDFVEIITVENFNHLKKTPMLLQQLIWLYCRGNDIDTSISDIYSNIVNVMFGWSKNKEEDEDYGDECANVPTEFEGLELPELLKKFPRCETNKRFIFILSKLSFEALTDSTSSYTLGRSKLMKYGLSKADIASLIKFGIIEEYSSLDPTYEQTCFSFIHLSYLEFFAAVYVSVRCHALRSSSQAKKRKRERTPVEDIFLKLHATADILEKSNLFLMLCGLSPFLVEELFCLISKTVRNDERLISNRENLFESDLEEPELIQKLLQDCCLECFDFNTAICLSDIFITSSDRYLISQINSKEVLSLCIEHYFLWDDYIMNWITQLPHLQLACIEIDNVECGMFNELLQALEQVVSLKQLFLYNRYNCSNLQYLNVISCEDDEKCECGGHPIDLSKHDQLQRIHFQYVTCIELSGLPPKNLQHFYISSSSVVRDDHTTFEELSSYLEKAVSLQQLIIDDIECDIVCRGHTINLSQHRHLKIIGLTCFSCMLGSVENTTNLESFSMVNTSDYMEHEMCDQLASSLTRAIKLKELRLENIRCTTLACKDHEIDLSKHDKLQKVALIDCCFSAVNSLIVVDTFKKVASFLDGFF